MLQSQKRQVRQFLSSEEVDNGTADCGINNDNMISMNQHHNSRMSGNLLAPPTLNYSALTNSAPAENYALYSKQNASHYEGAIDQGTFDITCPFILPINIKTFVLIHYQFIDISGLMFLFNLF